MPVAWNDSSDRQLLLTIIHLNAPKIDWKQVAAVMGEAVTDRAVSQHYTKIKKDFEELLKAAPGTAGTIGASASGTTPKKAATPKKTASGGGGKRKKAASLELTCDDDDEESKNVLREDTPMKKKKPKVKDEPAEDDLDYL